jgi:hypothetical protein
VVAVVAAAACAPALRHISLPTGAGTPDNDFAATFSNAAARCRSARTLQAELALSGHAGRQRLRGRVLAGFAPGAVRLEGVAPFGSPAFILAADTTRGTLLLPRDHRVLQNAAPADILNALIGVPLGADDLRAALAGCVKATAEPKSGTKYGEEWLSVDVGDGTIFLQRQQSGWRIVAGRYANLQIEYPQLAGDLPSQIVIQSSPADVELTIGLSQVEVNGNLPHDELIAVKVPEGTQPISVEELRRAGPLGAKE